MQAKINRALQQIATLKEESEEWLRGSTLHNHVITHFQNLFHSGVAGTTLLPPRLLFSFSDFNYQDMCDTLTHFPDKE